MTAVLPIVDTLIDIDRKALRVRFAFSALLIVIGIAIGFGALGQVINSGNEAIETAEKAAGVLSSLAGLYPFKDGWAHWQRLKTLEALKRNPDLVEAGKLKDWLTELLKRNIGV